MLQPFRRQPISAFVTSEPKAEELVETWVLPYAATLGSSVRRAGIFLEMRARLSPAARKSLTIDGGALILRMGAEEGGRFSVATKVIADAFRDIENLPVIPREIEHILQISSTERHRWLKDGRLPSAGTRTVMLRGRAKKVTFHIFDPRVVEDLLDRDRVSEWREQDALAATENRRRASWKAKLSRSAKQDASAESSSENQRGRAPSKLLGWDEFDRTGPLRKSSRSP